MFCEEWQQFAGELFLKIRLLAASAVFFMPVVREIFLANGLIDANRLNAEHWMGDKHRSIAILVGGSREMMMSEPNTDRLYLRKRRGFCRLALLEHSKLVFENFLNFDFEFLNFEF